MIKIVNKPDYGQLATVPVDPAEKRKFPRFPFSATVEVIDTHADIRIIGRLSDISQSGCYVDTISPFAQGATVSLKIREAASLSRPSRKSCIQRWEWAWASCSPPLSRINS